MYFKPLTEAEKQKMGRTRPLCGICLKWFDQVGEFEWAPTCEHYPGVIAHIGAPKEKKTRTKK